MIFVLLKYLFCERNMERVTLTVFSYNGSGVRLYEKLGFVREGVLREAVYTLGDTTTSTSIPCSAGVRRAVWGRRLMYEGKRVRLRGFHPVKRRSASDGSTIWKPCVWRGGAPKPRTLEESAAWINPPGQTRFAVETLDGRLIGMCVAKEFGEKSRHCTVGGSSARRTRAERATAAT
jgi:RimJ/RimL family protein N-acetyltransferase